MIKKRLVCITLVTVLLVYLIPFSHPNAAARGDTFSTISIGDDHSMAIKTDGSLWAWGYNNYGELGDGTRDTKHSPVKVMDDVVTVSAGAAIKTDGSLWAWGYNNYGELGDGTTDAKYSPVKVMDDATAVSVGVVFSMAIKTDGSLWAWGYNGSGQLGDGTTADKYSPVKVMDDVAAVSVGDAYSTAIKTDGSLWAWGHNDYGQLGDGTTDDKYSPVKVMDDVAVVSAGYDHTMAIKTDGSLWAWGYNYYGQLGDGTTDGKHSPVKVMDDVAAVSVGDWYHTMAIKTDGSLWAWGWNDYGQLGDGTTVNKYSPVNVMDGVAVASAGDDHSMAIKTDGSLWAWGYNYYGQLGDGTTDAKYSPVKVMDGVAVVASAGQNHSMAIKTDGSLWSWGSNEYGQLGDSTTADKHSPVKVMNDVMLPSGIQTVRPVAAPGYIYDITDPRELVNLPVNLLPAVTDRDSAVSVIQSAASGMTADQRQSATGIDLVTLFAEEAVAQAASTTVSGGIVINQTNVEALQATANDVRVAAEQVLFSNGVTTQREMQADVKFKTNDSASVTITIEPSAINTTVDNVRVETPDYAISFSAESIKANAGDSPLVITITEGAAVLSATANPSSLTSEGFVQLDMPGNYGSLNTTFLADDDTKTYTITFNKPVEENVKVSLPPTSGAPTYQAVTNSKGDAVGGKYNPITNKLEVKIKDSDTYKIRENKKDFSDIEKKSQEMQNAINILASKGIINGTTATTFSPDSPITRAEIAALIVRTLSHLDPNADGGFTDVQRSDWYFGAVGSAKKFGIVNGTTPTTFAPRSNIQKDQIVAICARTLRSEMKYKNPSNVSGILSVYTDSGSIAQWGLEDIALATRENLVVRRTDGTFNGSATMTRGDAAIILYRMFMKIW